MKQLIDRLRNAKFETIQLGDGKWTQGIVITMSRPELDAVIAALTAYHQLPPESC